MTGSLTAQAAQPSMAINTDRLLLTQTFLQVTKIYQEPIRHQTSMKKRPTEVPLPEEKVSMKSRFHTYLASFSLCFPAKRRFKSVSCWVR